MGLGLGRCYNSKFYTASIRNTILEAKRLTVKGTVIATICIIAALLIVVLMASYNAYWQTVAEQIAPVIGLLCLVFIALSVAVGRR